MSQRVQSRLDSSARVFLALRSVGTVKYIGMYIIKMKVRVICLCRKDADIERVCNLLLLIINLTSSNKSCITLFAQISQR